MGSDQRLLNPKVMKLTSILEALLPAWVRKKLLAPAEIGRHLENFPRICKRLSGQCLLKEQKY